jgi:hypothetical protein
MKTRIQIIVAHLIVGALSTGMVLAQNSGNPVDQKSGAQTNNRDGSTMSIDEKASLYDRLSESDKLASMRNANKDTSKMSDADRKSMMGKMTTQEKATAYDQLKPDQQNKLRMEARIGPNGQPARNPNDPNARDGQTPDQTRSPENVPNQPGNSPTTPRVTNSTTPTPGGAPGPGR